MRVLLFPVGSAGDVFPFVAVAKRLLARGHDVTLFGNGHFAARVARAGVPFVETEPAEMYAEAEKNADIWRPIKSFKALFGHPAVAEAMRRQYHLIRERYVAGDTVVGGGTLAFGPRVARDHLGVPLVSLHLQPAAFTSIERPAVYASGGMKQWWPRWAKRLLFWVGDRFIVDPIIGPVLNAFRAELGLPPVRAILTDGTHSPDRVIGLFPDWYCSPAPDWPPQTRLTGFPLDDGSDGQSLAPEVEAFLNAGPPPVVVTFGSAMRFAEPYFRSATEALGTLGRRGILLTPHADQVPADRPPGVAHFHYVPLGQLLPRAAGLVHHGGIGTAAQGLAAGVPQLVMPLAHDQPDNADRLRRLGVGRSLHPKRFTTPNVARELTTLDADEVRAAGRAVAGRFAGTDPVGRTCELIEEVGKKGGASAP
ncbi:MAG TPA: glycosyltransferase [Gemmataceae bacterium]|nr:glycosyltransferase [Gemmataceae bacterium]